MSRVPLRPLARILQARAAGANPDAIEHENLRRRREELRDRSRLISEGRLLVMAGLFLCAFGVVGARMGVLSASEPREPRAYAPGSDIVMAVPTSWTATAASLRPTLPPMRSMCRSR